MNHAEDSHLILAAARSYVGLNGGYRYNLNVPNQPSSPQVPGPHPRKLGERRGLLYKGVSSVTLNGFILLHRLASLHWKPVNDWEGSYNGTSITLQMVVKVSLLRLAQHAIRAN